MNLPTRKTVLIYLIATFVAGGVAGGAIGYGMGRRPVFRPFDREEMRVKICQRFTTELGLSPDQQQQMEPLVREGMDAFEQAHREHRERLRELTARGRERMETILTPEQREKYRAMEEERERRMPERFRGPKESGSPRGSGAKP